METGFTDTAPSMEHLGKQQRFTLWGRYTSVDGIHYPREEVIMGYAASRLPCYYSNTAWWGKHRRFASVRHAPCCTVLPVCLEPLENCN